MMLGSGGVETRSTDVHLGDWEWARREKNSGSRASMACRGEGSQAKEGQGRGEGMGGDERG